MVPAFSPLSRRTHVRAGPRYWHLIVQFALKDFKIRYTHSALGYAWSVLNPLIFSLIYYLVFSVFIRFDIPLSRRTCCSASCSGTSSPRATSNGVGSLLARGGLVTKVAFRRQ